MIYVILLTLFCLISVVNSFEKHIRQLNRLESLNSVDFKFGFIGDIQYADHDDAFNFQNTHLRRYRQSLSIYKDAIENWNKNNVKFSLVLGDQLDNLAQAKNMKTKCLNDFKSVSSTSEHILHYSYGNHDYYCQSREDIMKHFGMIKEENSHYHTSIGGNQKPSRLYYDFSPHEGWRFLNIDSYEVSLIGAVDDSMKEQAEEILSKNNPNDLNGSEGWFDNLPRDKYRFVPYNGGVSDKQLKWLENVLQKSKEMKEKCVIFCHNPILSPLKPQSVFWNAEEVLAIIRRHSNVVLWLAGHDHGGEYVYDDKSEMHMLVPPAPLECDKDELAFGHIAVNQKEGVLQVEWTGRLPRKCYMQWPKQLKISNADRDILCK